MEKKNDVISIIVPCHNEQEVLPFFLEEVEKVYNEMHKKYNTEFEYIFIDDGSKDKTLELLKGYAKENSRVNYISFSRNFGKEAGMYAGLQHATGDYVVIIDADLQDPPHLMDEMYKTLIETDYDCVASCRVDRKGESKIRSAFAHMFYKVIRKISKVDIVDGARDFRMMTRQMVDAIVSLEEYNRFSKGIFAWVGFKTKWLEFENVERVAGETKWSFWKLFKYSIEGVVAFSTAPLVIASIIGILFCIVAFFFIAVIVIRKLIFDDPVDGWASLVSIILFLGGLQLSCIGILGQYLAKTYLETKNRPIYIIGEASDE